jgi:hypothetical protein
VSIQSIVPGERVSEARAGLRSLWAAVYDSPFVRALRKANRFVCEHWRAFGFTRRFYTQICRAAVATPATETGLYPQDLTESLLQRTLPRKLHAMVQLRVASQIACIAETEERTWACHRVGWSDDEIKAVVLGGFEELFSEPEVLALRYADEMTRTPIDIDPQTVKLLRRYFNQPDLTELTASIAHENFRCRFTDANRRVQ